MSEKNVVQTELNDGDVTLLTSYATTDTPGIASFNSEDFAVTEDGNVTIKQKVGAIQYIGTIIEEGDSSLIWSITKDISPKKLSDVKLNDLVLLAEDYGDYEAGSVFAVSALIYPELQTKKIAEFSIRGSIGSIGPKGDTGTDGVTPDISMTASVDQTIGTATVMVNKGGTLVKPEFDIAFSGIKGETGAQGPKGDAGDNLYVHMEIEDGKLYLLSDSVMSNEFVLEDGCLYVEDV